MQCKICKSEATILFSKKVLFKYDVKYFRCPNCKFIQTEEPFWLEEAYKSAINHSDIGIANRSVTSSDISTALFNKLRFDKTKKFLDHGAGYGLYVRMMRDKGYNFYWSDEYCENIFASKYAINDIPVNERQFEVVTAFEVFEHLPDPISEIEQLLKISPNLFFSTNLINSCKGDINDWWYISPMHGQHIAFYDKATLDFIGKKYGLNVYSHKNFHLLTTKKISRFTYKLLTYSQIAQFMNLIFPNKSLNGTDWESYVADYEKLAALNKTSLK